MAITVEGTPRHFLNVGQAAEYLGVSAASLRNWSDQGKVPVYRTPGGQRRTASPISRSSSSRGARPRPLRDSPAGAAYSACSPDQVLQLLDLALHVRLVRCVDARLRPSRTRRRPPAAPTAKQQQRTQEAACAVAALCWAPPLRPARAAPLAARARAPGPARPSSGHLGVRTVRGRACVAAMSASYVARRQPHGRLGCPRRARRR